MASDPISGRLHHISQSPNLTTFEFGALSSPCKGVVLFVGGLNDTYLSVPYLPRLADALKGVGWALAQVALSSAGDGWGGRTISEDAEQLAVIGRYWREQRGIDKLVLMGHSTGTQDAIAYLHLTAFGPDVFPPLAGVILQAPVSDREYIEANHPGLLSTLPAPSPADDPATFVPPALSSLFGTHSGITSRRWRSLTAPPPSDVIHLDESEDFFSSDLSDARLANVFEPVSCPLLVLLSGDDSSYPPHVKAQLPTLMGRFQEAVDGRWWSGESAILEGASHNVAGVEQAQELAERVCRFVEELS
ncbi:hypothetical protein JCM5296_007341 [Sporobolomyces johnsonii]